MQLLGRSPSLRLEGKQILALKGEVFVLTAHAGEAIFATLGAAYLFLRHLTEGRRLSELPRRPLFGGTRARHAAHQGQVLGLEFGWVQVGEPGEAVPLLNTLEVADGAEAVNI